MTRRGGAHRAKRASTAAVRGESPRSLRELFGGADLRRLRDGEDLQPGVVVFSDGVDEWVLKNSIDNDAVRQTMRSHCDDCAASDLRTARGW